MIPNVEDWQGMSLSLIHIYAYSHLKETVKILLIEEPENHLSFQNLQKLVNMLSSNTGVQVFIGTHSNMIASRLGVDNLHFLDNGQISKLEGLNRDCLLYTSTFPGGPLILSNAMVG